MTARIALVTGATSGIGREYAIRLAERGWSIVAAARDAGRLEALCAGLSGDGHEALVVDLSTNEGMEQAAQRLRAVSQPISLLINAAGSGTSAPFPEAPLEEEVQMLRVNVDAVLHVSYAAAHAMRERGQGAIINISSTAAYWSAGTYAASKSWVLAMTLGLRAQLHDSGVRVLAVAPGFTRTEFHARTSTDASGVQPWLWLDPDEVVTQSLEALAADRAVCIPGRRYRALVEAVRHLPPGGRRAVLRRLAPLRGTQRDGE
ncbi:MAG: SDR family NAD(P)-dependent oxidoreductase [Miltoncostaeaceae bacterium]